MLTQTHLDDYAKELLECVQEENSNVDVYFVLNRLSSYMMTIAIDYINYRDSEDFGFYCESVERMYSPVLEYILLLEQVSNLKFNLLSINKVMKISMQTTNVTSRQLLKNLLSYWSRFVFECNTLDWNYDTEGGENCPDSLFHFLVHFLMCVNIPEDLSLEKLINCKKQQNSKGIF